MNHIKDISISKLNHGKEPLTISFDRYSKIKMMLMIIAPTTETRNAVAFGDELATNMIIKAMRLAIWKNEINYRSVKPIFGIAYQFCEF